MPEPGNLIGNLFGIYFLILGGFAAIAASTAIQEDDRAGLPMRVFWSLTKTTLFLGFPGLIALLVLMRSESKGGGGGIMSPEMGLFILFMVGAGALFVLWLGCITMGFIGAAIARKLPPLAAAAVVFAGVGLGPVFIALVFSMESEQQKRERLRRMRGEAPISIEQVLRPS